MANYEPIKFEVKIGGLEELARKFSAMEGKLDEILEQATSAGAAIVVREAAINSRKGGDNFPHRITGNLMRSITMISKKTSGHRCEIQVGSDMDYARRLEFGFNDTDKKGRRYHQRPRPFMTPALDENKDGIQEEFETVLKTLEGML